MKISRFSDPVVTGVQFTFPSGVKVSIRKEGGWISSYYSRDGITITKASGRNLKDLFYNLRTEIARALNPNIGKVIDRMEGKAEPVDVGVYDASGAKVNLRGLQGLSANSMIIDGAFNLDESIIRKIAEGTNRNTNKVVAGTPYVFNMQKFDLLVPVVGDSDVEDSSKD